MARCSETATDLQGLMLCCEARGWQYTLESRAQLEIDDREIAPRGHMASVTTTRGYFAHVLGSKAQDALRAALTAVEAMDERWAKPNPRRHQERNLAAITTVLSQALCERDGATEQNGAGYARAQLSPDVPSVTWQAVATDRLENGQPDQPIRIPRSAEDLLRAAWSQYAANAGIQANPASFWAFRGAIVEQLGGQCLPGRNTVWAQHEMPDRDDGALNGTPAKPATPEQVTMTEDPGPPTAQERLDRAYREYRDSDAPEWLAFQSAIVGNLGGCCLPGAGQDWSRVKPVLIGTGERGH